MFAVLCIYFTLPHFLNTSLLYCFYWVVRCWLGYLSGARCRLAYAQLMPLPLTVSCFIKIQIGFTFLVPAHPGSPGKRAVKRVCVCGCVCVILLLHLVGCQEEHLTCKNWVSRCWCGYLSGARCRLFACGPADATASQNPIFSCLI